MMKYILIFIYVAISILLFVLNWDLFTTIVSFDMVVGTFNTLPFLALQIFGGIILGLFAFFDGVKDLKREVKINEMQNTIITMKKDAEIEALKKVYNAKIHEKKPEISPSASSEENN